MTGGSIYIDPDSVSNVSSQIGMTANQLEVLRQSIVPQVNEVIMMSYPSIQEMPGVAYPLDSTQGNIEAFNYRAQILVEDLRTTSMKLTQVAEAGRTMNEILLRQTTMFGVMGAGGNVNISPGGADNVSTVGIPDWLKQMLGTGGTYIGLANTLVGLLGLSNTIANSKLFEKFSVPLDKISGKLDTINFLIDLMDSSNNPKELVSKLIGHGIGKGVDALIGDNPYGLAIMASFGVVSFAGAGLGSLQGMLANQYAGNPQLQQSLNSTANGLLQASKNADPQKVFDDVGGTLFDTGAALFGHGSWSSVGNDARGMLNDTGSTLYSVPQFLGNTDIMLQQDANLGLNALVQNSPLPASWKSVYQSNTYSEVNTLGQYANAINNVPSQAGKLTDAAQNILVTSSQQFYNQEVVVQ